MTRKEARGGRTQNKNKFEKLQDRILLHDELNAEAYVYHITTGILLFVSVGIEYERESVTGRLEKTGTEEVLAASRDLKKRAYRRHVMVDQAKRHCSTRAKGT
jgi:hypothetical protein